ncbi:kinase-like domain-containing protein [Schizophyllum commune]
MAYTFYSPFDYDRFRFEALLACGSFGSVYRAVDTYRNQSVAIKVQKKPAAGSHVAQRQQEETCIHAALYGHPNIVSLWGAHETPGGIYHHMDLSDGIDLHDALKRKIFADRPGLIKRGFGQIISALAYMHGKRFYHRDIKPENILLSADLRTWRLCDFGLATPDDWTRGKGAGSGFYRSPESLVGEYDNGPADVWSLGMTLLYLVTGRKPWAKATPEDKLYNLFLESGPQFFLVLGDMTAQFFQFIRRFFELDPTKRITLREAARELKALSLDAFRPGKNIDYDAIPAYRVPPSPASAATLEVSGEDEMSSSLPMLSVISSSTGSTEPCPRTPKSAPYCLPPDRKQYTSLNDASRPRLCTESVYPGSSSSHFSCGFH